MRYETKGKRNIDLGFDIPENKELRIIDSSGLSPKFMVLGGRKIHLTSKPSDYIDVELLEKPIRKANNSILQSAGAFDVSQEVKAILEKQNAIKQAFSEILVFKKEIDSKLSEHELLVDGQVKELWQKHELDKQTTDDSLIELSNGFKLNTEEIKHIYSIISKLNQKAEETDVGIKDIMLVLSKHEHPKATKESIGLGKADNTSDFDKPISKATQKALDKKASIEDVSDLLEKITKLQKKQKDFQRGIDILGGMGVGNSNIEVDNKLSSKSENPVQNKVITSSIIIKSNKIPSAEKQNIGTEYQYMGETNETYTHGYIYEVISTQTATSVEFGSDNITWGVDDFVNYLKEGGDAWNEVTHGTLIYDASGEIWTLNGFNSDNVRVMSFKEYTEDLEDFGCVFTNPPQEGDSSTFTLTTEQTGKKWKRIDVQPEGGGVTSVNGKTGVVVINSGIFYWGE